MKIIITGSLGNIGKPLTEELVQKGHEVTVISSKAEKQTDIEALGATAAIGSLEDVNFLTSAFTGANAVFAMIPPSFTEPDVVVYYQRLANNYAEAIRQAGVTRVVHLSSIGAHLNHGTGPILGSHHAEHIFNELEGAAVTHLRPAYFYYNLYNFVDMIKEQGIIGSNYGGDDQMVMVAPGDIAAAAAEELERSAQEGNIRYIVSEDLTGNQAAHILGAAIGKPDLQWLVFTNEQVKDALEKSGMPAPLAANFTDMGASIHSGALREDYDNNKPVTLGKTKLQDFANEFAAAF